MRLPDGFALRRFDSGRVLICRADRIDIAVAAGLASPERWAALLAGERGEQAGRGAVARFPLPGSGVIVLKKMRRGGALAGLRGDRFLDTGRLVRNLTVPIEALRRGAPTAAPVLLLLQQRAGRGAEAWLGVEEIPGAADLRARLSAPDPPDEAELGSAMRAVRALHDAGVVHPDLNLGNLLTRREGAGWAGFVVDLDRARLNDGPLPIRARRAALRRIERSYRKCFPDGGPLGADAAEVWYRLYAGGNESLLDGVTRGRAAARIGLALHEVGWKLRGRR